MTEDDLAATCIAGEAGNQPYEGKVAVGIVILNRVNIPYASDGTVTGAVEHPWAFSEFWAGMTSDGYKALPADQQGAPEARALFDEYSTQPIWADCQKAWADAKAWRAGEPMSFTPGPAFAGLTRRTVLYYAPNAVPTPPAWATPDKLDAVIFAHHFFHDA